MSRAPRKERDTETPESDVFEGAPHPRHAVRLIGHASAEAEMLNAYRGGRLAHAWLIGGREGIGKATLAWRFARFLLSHPDPAAPEVVAARDLSVPDNHPVAHQLAAMAHPDFALLRRAFNEKTERFFTEIGVDDVRDQMHIFRLSSAFGGYRIAIVDAADELNKSSANALLKIIEEPPAKSLILILAHRMGAVMPTIRSRCRRLLLEPLKVDEIVEIISGLDPPYPEARADRIAEAAAKADGSVREALRRLDPASQTMAAMIESAIQRLPRGDAKLNTRLAEALSLRGAERNFDLLFASLFDWLVLARRASPVRRGGSKPSPPCGTLLRGFARDADALNIDKRATVLAAFEEIAARAGALG